MATDTQIRTDFSQIDILKSAKISKSVANKCFSVAL